MLVVCWPDGAVVEVLGEGPPDDPAGVVEPDGVEPPAVLDEPPVVLDEPPVVPDEPPAVPDAVRELWGTEVVAGWEWKLSTPASPATVAPITTGARFMPPPPR